MARGKNFRDLGSCWLEAPSLLGKKVARLVCHLLSWLYRLFGRIERVGVEGKGARDWVLSPALEVRRKVVLPKHMEKLQFLAGICESCRGGEVFRAKEGCKGGITDRFCKDAWVLFWMWRVYIKRDLHFAEQYFRIYNSGKSPWKH